MTTIHYVARRLAHLGFFLVLALLCAAAPAAARDPSPPASVWDSALADDAPRVAGSAALVAELRRQAGLPGGTWINTTSQSVPVYTGRPNPPPARGIPDPPSPPLQQGWSAVPLPAGAHPAAGS